MRGSALILMTVLATAAACSPKAPAPPPAPVAAVTPPAPKEATPAAAPAVPAETAAPAPPAAPEAVRFSPTDYGVHERRVTALINNAESRDTTGETQYLAQQARAQRMRCRTKACIEQSYAAEEARLRKWEGASDIK
jgi:hypothetical protein